MIHEATRTLVKSPPEIWEQCSDPESLSRHLNGSFGEIRITRLQPESTVAWEGEHGSGTVTIEPSAWGTRVTLTAHTEQESAEVEEAAAPEEPPLDLGEEPEAEVESPEPEPEPAPEPDLLEPVPPAPQQSRESLIGLIARFWRRRPVADPVPAAPGPPVAEPEAEAFEPEPEISAEPALEPPSPPAEDAQDRTGPSAILMAALESMGQAHHRPYSRG